MDFFHKIIGKKDGSGGTRQGCDGDDFVIVKVLKPTILIELRRLLYFSSGPHYEEIFWNIKIGKAQQRSHVIHISTVISPNQALFFRLPEVEAGFAILAVQLMGLDVVSHAERLIAETSVSLSHLRSGTKQSCWVPLYNPITRSVVGEQLLCLSTTDLGMDAELNPSPFVRVLSSPKLMTRAAGVGEDVPLPPPDPSLPPPAAPEPHKHLASRKSTSNPPPKLEANSPSLVIEPQSSASELSNASGQDADALLEGELLHRNESAVAELFEMDSLGRITHFGSFGAVPFDIWMLLIDRYLYPTSLHSLPRLNRAFGHLAPRIRIAYRSRRRSRACLEAFSVQTEPKARFFCKGVVSLECLPNQQLALLSHNSIRIANTDGTVTRLISRQFEAVDFVLIQNLFVVATFRSLHCYTINGEAIPIKTPRITTPRGVAVDEHGLVYVVDHKPGVVHTFEPPGYVSPPPRAPPPASLAAADTTASPSLLHTPDTSLANPLPAPPGVAKAALPPVPPPAAAPAVPKAPPLLGAGVLDLPQAVAAAGDEVYVTDVHNDRVHVFDVHTHALKRYIAGLANPCGLLIDPALNVFIIEAKQIQVFDKTGVFICRFGKFGEARRARLNDDGDLFVLDYGRSEIVVF